VFSSMVVEKFEPVPLREACSRSLRGAATSTRSLYGFTPPISLFLSCYHPTYCGLAQLPI
jgi:hypothetical protein